MEYTVSRVDLAVESSGLEILMINNFKSFHHSCNYTSSMLPAYPTIPHTVTS
jgi:hypothetical protein